MKALVVGYGSIGKRHVQNLLSIPNMKIIVCTKRKDVDLPQNCLVLESLSECIIHKPDFAIISNVSNIHVSTAIKLAKSEIDLFIEKPLSDTMNGIDELLSIVKKKNLITLMGCNLRFHKCIKKIKEILITNQIGRVISVSVESGSYLPDWHTYEDYKQSYASRKDMGGGVVLTSIHEIDYLYWFFKNVKEVVSMTGKYSDLEIEVEDFSAIILRFNNNIIAEIHLDYFQRPNYRSCKIIGSNGTIRWDSEKNVVKVYSINDKKWIKEMELKNFDRNDMYVDELNHFIDCVNNRKESINSLESGIETLKIALACKESSRMKKVLKVV